MKNKHYATIALYTRVSTREQAMKGYSIQAQENKLKRYLKENHITYDTLLIFSDEGYSGGSTKRPGFSNLEKDIKNKKVELILVTKLDRISREPVDLEMFFQLCRLHSAVVTAITGEIKIDTANGRFVTGILSLISKWERETVMERTFDTLTEMCEDGMFPYGYTPFGYIKEKKRLSIDKEKSEIVKKIFRWAESGNPLELISKKVKENYHINIRADRIGIMLSKEYYLGEFIYGGKKYYNVVPAIISKESFLNAQSVRNKRYLAIQNKNFYFKNQIKCSCGTILCRRLTKKKFKRYYYYYCPNCDKRINQTKLIQELMPDLLRYISNETLNKEIKTYKRKYKNICNKIEHLYENYVNGIIDDKIYAFTLSKLSNDKDTIVNKINLKYSIGLSDFKLMTNEQRYELMETHVNHIIVDIKLKVILKISIN